MKTKVRVAAHELYRNPHDVVVEHGKESKDEELVQLVRVSCVEAVADEHFVASAGDAYLSESDSWSTVCLERGRLLWGEGKLVCLSLRA